MDTLIIWSVTIAICLIIVGVPKLVFNLTRNYLRYRRARNKCIPFGYAKIDRLPRY